MPRKSMNKTTVTADITTEPAVTEVVETKPAKKVFEPNEGVRCRSVTHGKLFVNGVKTGMKYIFFDYDDDVEIEYRDLVGLVRARDKAVYNPRFIIMDEDFIAEYPTLRKFYSEHFSTTNLGEILDMPNAQMKEAIANLPKSAVESLKAIAVNRISSGEIDSVRKIKALDEVFNTDLSLFNELLSD